MTTAAATKFQLGTAALALAAAATLTPVVAQADSMAPLAPSLTSLSKALGDSAGEPVAYVVCDGPNSTGDCTFVAGASANATADALAASSTGSWLTPIFQNQLWWFGTPNPNPPTGTVIFEFNPLNFIPDFLKPLFGWFENINFESCVGGLSTTIGPYGTVTTSISRGCA